MVMKPQVIDAFMFNNELDVLNFRLHELNEHVDKFVIYENSWTFSGNKKPLYFEENKEMFSKFSGKIVHIKSNTRGKNNWKSEYSQRHEVLAKGVSSLNLNNKDVVSFCDLDEIIDPKLISNYKQELPQDAPLLVCPHWFNVSWDCYLGAWQHHSIIFSYWGELQKRMSRWKGMQCGWRWDHPKFAQPIKKKDLSGWHTSWFMEPEGLIIKLKSFAHNGEDWVTEILKNIDLINHRIKSGKDVTGKFNSEQFNFPYPAYKNLVSYELKK
jgi:beta-1,4-mannosyl-glycoprotein beta-1,4-N-acetylglucosaminyltransferase